MQDNDSSYIILKPAKLKEGKIARFQVICEELNKVHQVDFFKRRGKYVAVLDNDLTHELGDIKPNVEAALRVSFSEIYPFNIFVESCNSLESNSFCDQKVFEVNKGHWRTAITKKNKKILFTKKS